MERLGSYEYADALDAFLAHTDDLIACLVESGALERLSHDFDVLYRRRTEGADR